MTADAEVPVQGGTPALADEREHLLRSIEDLDREREAGEVEEGDYAALREQYVLRAAAVLRKIEAAEVHGAGVEVAGQRAGRRRDRRRARWRRALGRRRTRRALWAALALCAAALVTIFAMRAAGLRLPGETSSGSVTLDTAQQVREELVQAQDLGSAGDVSDALSLYQEVLVKEPHQPEALAYRGWLLRLTGLSDPSKADSKELVAAGRASIEEAVNVDPGYAPAHLFLGLALLEDSHQLKASVAQFRDALADHVSASLVEASRPIIVKAFEEAHQAVPASLRGS